MTIGLRWTEARDTVFDRGVSADFLYRPYAMQVLSVYKVLQQARCAVRTTKTLDYKDEVAAVDAVVYMYYLAKLLP